MTELSATNNPAGEAMTAKILCAIAATGPIAYVGLVTAMGMSWEGYEWVRDTQSELGAVDSPYKMLMNVAGFMGLGVSMLAFAGGYLLVLRRGWAKATATCLIAVAGIGMIVVGFFPCDAGCVDLTTTGRLHGLFSMPGAIGLPVTAILSSLVFRIDGRLGTGWQVLSFWLGLLTLASGPIVQAGLFASELGLIQRAGMWSSLAWMVAVSVKLYSLAGESLGGAGPGRT